MRRTSVRLSSTMKVLLTRVIAPVLLVAGLMLLGSTGGSPSVLAAEPVNLKFDFGSATSPVAAGYQQVANTMVYTSERGYGFDEVAIFRDRGAPDDLRRDFTAVTPDFKVNLPNGAYDVKIIAGDNIASNTTTVSIEGVVRGTITSTTGNFSELTVRVTVTDGQMNVSFGRDGRVNAIEIASADTTPPVITITTPEDGATYLLNADVLADYACNDEVGGSGVASCVGTLANGATVDTSSVGPETFTVQAIDNATNPSSESVDYTVIYGFSNFSSPVDTTLPNRAKAGQTIPLKWRVTDASGAPVTTLSAVQVSVTSLSCAFEETPDAVEEYASGSLGLKNLGDGYYQFNWNTPKGYVNLCKTLQLDLGDGIVHTAEFQFTK